MAHCQIKKICYLSSVILAGWIVEHLLHFLFAVWSVLSGSWCRGCTWAWPVFLLLCLYDADCWYAERKDIHGYWVSSFWYEQKYHNFTQLRCQGFGVCTRTGATILANAAKEVYFIVNMLYALNHTLVMANSLIWFMPSKCSILYLSFTWR